MIKKTSYAAAFAELRVEKYGAAFPKLNTPIIITKNTRRIFPIVYSERPVTGSISSVNFHPYQNPRAYAEKITSLKILNEKLYIT